MMRMAKVILVFCFDYCNLHFTHSTEHRRMSFVLYPYGAPYNVCFTGGSAKDGRRKDGSSGGMTYVLRIRTRMQVD